MKPSDPPVRIVSARFVAAAGPGATLPESALPEIAFAGRSNVGKSSLINALVGRKNLVRTSSKPGATRQIALFEARAADGRLYQLVDLPGYGFTKRSKTERASWGALVEGFLGSRASLAGMVLLVDVRRGLEDDDRQLLDFLRGARPNARVVLAATKLDKLSRAARPVALDRLSRAAGVRVVGTSAETGEGMGKLWGALVAMAGAPQPGEDGHKTVDGTGPDRIA